MKIKILTLFFLFFSFSANALLPLDRLGLLLGHMQTFQASFQQKTFDSNGKLIEKNQGTLISQKPNRFRFESQGMTEQLMVTDGKVVWIYDKDLAQASRYPLKEVFVLNPAVLLSGDTKEIARLFVVKENPQDTFILTGKTADNPFQVLKLIFSHQRLQKMQFLNNLQQTIVLDFSDIKINHPLSSSIFTFKPPHGVDVLQGNKNHVGS